MHRNRYGFSFLIANIQLSGKCKCLWKIFAWHSCWLFFLCVMSRKCFDWYTIMSSVQIVLDGSRVWVWVHMHGDQDKYKTITWYCFWFFLFVPLVSWLLWVLSVCVLGMRTCVCVCVCANRNKWNKWNFITTAEAIFNRTQHHQCKNWIKGAGKSPWELTQILHRCVDVSYGASVPCGGTRWAGGFGQRGAIGTGCLNGLALVTPYRWQAGHEGCVVLKTGWGPSGEENIATNIWTIRDNKLPKVEQEIKTERKGRGEGNFNKQ